MVSSEFAGGVWDLWCDVMWCDVMWWYWLQNTIIWRIWNSSSWVSISNIIKICKIMNAFPVMLHFSLSPWQPQSYGWDWIFRSPAGQGSVSCSLDSRNAEIRGGYSKLCLTPSSSDFIVPPRAVQWHGLAGLQVEHYKQYFRQHQTGPFCAFQSVVMIW